MTPHAPQNREQIEREIIAKAVLDQTFRHQLVSQPRVTLQELLGSALPVDVQIDVLEETPLRFYIVLPPAGVVPGTELSDAALGTVAAGMGDSWSDGTCAGAFDGRWRGS